jgi:anti-sigma28 factor (negative regulator of flagellin synthesis)
MKSAHERAEEQKQEKLAEIREQIKEGTLVVRKMTDAERKKYPRRDVVKPKRTYRVR